MADALGAPAPVYLPHVEKGHGDGWLQTDDRAPNAQGCERLGIHAASPEAIKARLEAGDVDVLYVMEDDPVASGVCSATDLSGIKVVLHHYNTTNQTLEAADVAIPAATAVETVGTFVNVDGHAQRLRPAKAIAGVNRTLSMEIGKCRADRHGTPFDKWYNESNLVNCQPGWVALPAVAAEIGLEMNYKGPKQIMEEVSSSNPAFRGATYSAMGELGVRLESTGVTA